ncbi:hypothetical protein K0T92_10855 [Paenibacillus oenotherae]|uniref:Uncharacterized protein n=1 Tax=Paenibacillus oenotherae TaxID=1435645 RepID=A0ABS7D5W1_9BACL|nr:hypothetical protein [Paenibacillus oenotherae]MBW7475246.1 hypothetical protein [Paenibacillus oenotherae]
MENWEHRLASYYGKRMELIIEDYAGSDPLAPPASRPLHHVMLAHEGTHLQFYFNEKQFLAIPVYDDDRTRLQEAEQGTVFTSEDTAAKLIYTVRFLL